MEVLRTLLRLKENKETISHKVENSKLNYATGIIFAKRKLIQILHIEEYMTTTRFSYKRRRRKISKKHQLILVIET